VTAAPVSLNRCTIKRVELEDPQRVEVGRSSRGERRRRNLRRGIDRWHQDVLLAARPRYVWRVALTFTSDDPLAARGKIRDFWKLLRDQVPGIRYFSWAELQHRGALHYHALIVDPPWSLEREARRWLTDHWPWSGIQPDVHRETGRWFRRRGGRYVKAYAKKPRPSIKTGNGPAAPAPRSAAAGDRPDKSYQQDYDELPREIRTFQCSRLAHFVQELDGHRERVEIAWIYDPDPVTGRIATGWVLARVAHTSAPRGCSLRKKKRAPSAPTPGPFTRRPGGPYTRQPVRA
jgi:hypothetical protein